MLSGFTVLRFLGRIFGGLFFHHVFSVFQCRFSVPDKKSECVGAYIEGNKMGDVGLPSPVILHVTQTLRICPSTDDRRKRDREFGFLRNRHPCRQLKAGCVLGQHEIKLLLIYTKGPQTFGVCRYFPKKEDRTYEIVDSFSSH